MRGKDKIKDLTFKQKLFFMFEILGFVSSVMAFISALSNHLPAEAMISSFACVIVMVLNLFYTFVFFNIKAAGMLCCVSLNFIMFPLLFFFSGGVKSGMMFFFLLGVTVSTLILDGKERLFMLLTTLLEDIACLLYGFSHIEQMSILTPEQYKSDVITSYCIVAIFLVIVVTTLIREYDKEHERIMEYNEVLKRSSMTDEMTQLYNHRFAEKKLREFCQKASEENKPLSLLMLDIDYFKNVNDTYGHLRGNSVLSCFAEIMMKEVKEGQYVTRYGGEEFLILLYDCPAVQAYNIGEKIRIRVENNVALKGLTEGGITISGGVAEYRDGLSPDVFIEEADRNLYKAKDLGRNKIIF